MFATVVVVCPSGSSVSASMPTAIVIDVGAAASPPPGTPVSATPAAHTRTTASGGLICLRLIILLPPLRRDAAGATSPGVSSAPVWYAFMPPHPSPPLGSREGGRRMKGRRVDGSAPSTSNSRIGLACAEGCESLAESGGLENRYTRKGIGSSNLPPSATECSARDRDERKSIEGGTGHGGRRAAA